MTFTFRPAKREAVGLIVGLAGPSGGGKTYSAMRLAKGICGDDPFAVIDTEAGRAKHYADRFRFDHGDLRPPFSPGAYADAIQAADKAGYRAIVVDSFSHEHAGEGGLLDWHDAEFKRLGSKDSMKMLAWVAPKMAHRQMVSRLLQVRAHLILCFRAEEKIDMVKGANGKLEIVPKQTLSGFHGWVPICEKNLLFELTASFMLMPDKPGIPVPVKLQEQHRAIFPAGHPINEESGAWLADWAKGDPLRVPEADTERVAITAAERLMRMTQIRELSAKVGLTAEQRRGLWYRHCGEATEQTVDPAALADLYAALQRQQGGHT
jgi:hypothetical protein